MFRIRTFVTFFGGFVVLAFVSHPVFTALHNQLGKLTAGTMPASGSLLGTKEKGSKARQPANNDYGKLPIYFEPNLGQTDSEVKFIARGSGVTTFLTATEAVFSLPIADFGLPIEETDEDRIRNEVTFGLQAFDPGLLMRPPARRNLKSAIANRQSAITNQSTIRMQLVGANPKARIEGLDRLPGTSNYFIGNDPAKWRTNVPHYAKVRYRDVYPGIDLVYYANERNLEYDLVVKPGADPRRIELGFEGADEIHLNDRGALVVKAAGIELHQCLPRIYQEDNDGRAGTRNEIGRKEVAGHFVIRNERRIGVALSSYDVTQTLIIDPVIVYSSFLGGNHYEYGQGIAVDFSGNAYVTGSGSSTDFPATPGALPFQSTGNVDAFVARVNQKGDTLLFLAYLGGSGSDYSRGIALDSEGNAYLAGSTYSDNFPATANAYQRTQGGGRCGRQDRNACSDAFIAKLNFDGNSLLYSTYLGGDAEDNAFALAVEASGIITVAGTASARAVTSRPFPVTPGAYQTSVRGELDAFIARFSANGLSLVYSTFLGGTGSDYPFALATDAASNSYVTGMTTSSDLPVTPGAIQSTHGGPVGQPGGGQDAFVAKLNSSGTGLVYATYLGGGSEDTGQSIAVDSLGNTYVGGSTASRNFLVSSGAFQRQLLGTGDGFLSKLNPGGTGLVFSTLLGGSDFDRIGAVALEPSGRIVVAGSSGSADFPLQTAPFGQYPGGSFVALMSGAGDRLVSSISLGGWWEQSSDALAVDASGHAYVAGRTLSEDFPTVYPFQPSPGQNIQFGDAFIAKISFSADLPERLFVPIVLSSSGANGSYFTSELTVVNRGSQDARLEFTYTAAIGSGSGTASDVLLGSRQKIVPDALAYLRALGIPIPETGNQGGTLSIVVRGVPAQQIGVVVRATTPTGNGRAGLAYGGVSLSQALWGPSYLVGLRQDGQDRSNIAIQNMGDGPDGEITLRVTVFGTKPSGGGQFVLPDMRLSPGEFRQINSILTSNGLALQEGFVRVERVTGKAPYYAYAVINDQVTSDGSFVVPIRSDAFEAAYLLVVPAVVESGLYESELILTNTSDGFRNVALRNMSDAIQPPGREATVEVPLQLGEQRIIRNYVQWLRDSEPFDATVGSPYAGVLYITQANGPNYGLSGVIAAVRVSSRTANRFGVFYPTSPPGSFTQRDAWLYGLQQNSTTRSNLALVNVGSDAPYKIELFDGETGSKVATVDSSTPASWLQLNGILAQYAPGVTQAYARVSRREGYGSFITYAVINDGATPGERTGDGAFIASSP